MKTILSLAAVGVIGMAMLSGCACNKKMDGACASDKAACCGTCSGTCSGDAKMDKASCCGSCGGEAKQSN